jgi:hypothetical protein
VPDHLDSIDRELATLLRPVAKAGPHGLPHAAENEPARLRFVASIDELDRQGWSWERIARHLNCTRTMVIAVYHGHRYVSARWLDRFDAMPELQALPTRMRVAQLRKVS